MEFLARAADVAMPGNWPELADVVVMLYSALPKHHKIGPEACTDYSAMVDAAHVIVTVCVRAIAG